MGEQRDLINDVFRTGQDNPNLAEQTLLNYARIARNAMEDPVKATARAIEEQSRRLDLGPAHK